MFPPRGKFQIMALCLTALFLFLWILNSTVAEKVQQKYPATFGGGRRSSAPPACNVTANVVVDEPADDPIWDIQNSTLGFQKIYAISMPHRTDKRDSLSLMALVSGLNIDFIDGVNGSAMHPAAVPPYWQGEKSAGDIGVWRAHLNVYQTMIREHIQSALVLEDDADWDVLIKAQMTELARGTRYLKNVTLPMHSPYGDDWDLIILGHLGVNNKPNKDQQYWVTKNDPTVLAPSRHQWSRIPDFSAPALGGNYTRIVHKVSKMSITATYAISLRGAARLLYDQTMMPNAQAIDLAMLKLCRWDTWGLPFCLGAYPMIFGRYRAIGPRSKDSDRRQQSNEATSGTKMEYTDERLQPESQFTVFPVSLNIGRLLKSESVIPAVEPNMDLMSEVDLSQFVFPKGHGVFVTPNDYVSHQKSPEEQILQIESDEGYEPVPATEQTLESYHGPDVAEPSQTETKKVSTGEKENKQAGDIERMPMRRA